MSKTIEELIADRDAFLEKHPHLKPVQEKLDEDMKDMEPLVRCSLLFERISNEFGRLR